MNAILIIGTVADRKPIFIDADPSSTSAFAIGH